MKSRKRGWAWVGLDWNSGWNWTARNQGWSGASTISTNDPSGLRPVGTKPDSANRRVRPPRRVARASRVGVD